MLFVRALEGREICLDEAKREYKIFDLDAREFVSHPNWEAGVVTQMAGEKLVLDDLLTEVEKHGSVVMSGFRVEPLPDPNGADKSLSKKYNYVPLHCIRPMAFWKAFVHGINRDQWHPTIGNALKVFSSFSLAEKYRFKGAWPNAKVFCRGLYLGPEFIVIGDAVRLMPDPIVAEDNVSDVLHITNIIFQLGNLDKASDNDADDGHPYNSSVVLIGKGYTLDSSKSFNQGPVLSRPEARDLNLPKGMTGYDYWYRLHEPDKLMQIPFSRVMGRCYEAEPMLLWFPSSNPDVENPVQYPSLSQGLTSIRHARKFSSKSDTRIQESKEWYWGDSRSDSLGIAEFNGVPVSAHDPERDEEKLSAWADYVSALERVAGHEERIRIHNRLPTGSTGNVNIGNVPAGPMAPPQPVPLASAGASDETDTISEIKIEGDDEGDADRKIHSQPTASNKAFSMGESQDNSNEASPVGRMSESQDGSGERHEYLAARFGLGPPQKTSESEESNEHQHGSLAARFGLGAPRKRSRSVASVHDAAMEKQVREMNTAQKYGKNQRGYQNGLDDDLEIGDDDDESGDVKQVARSGKGLSRGDSPSKRVRL